MLLSEVVQNIIADVAVDLTQAFDRNFEEKGFFGRKWKQSKLSNNRGSLMMRTGKLRRSINYRKTESSISWTSNLPYASLQNEGGEVVVTEKMKKFFWAMFYKTGGGKQKGKSQRAERLNGEAAQWRAMALKKVGSKIEIEQRQFIGWHPEVNRRIAAIHKMHALELDQAISKKIKP